MNWKVRHEGSPKHVEMPLEALQQGLVDGVWEPTDEVMGPGETAWQAIENHPVLAELAADLEPPPPPAHDDETRLDMNALIDVCLVLLVFFMLTTTVAALQTRLDAPGVGEKKNIKVVNRQKAEETMIPVTIKMQAGQPVVYIGDRETSPDRLLRAFQDQVKASGRTTILLEHDDDVPHKVVVQVLDAANGAGINQVQLAVP